MPGTKSFMLTPHLLNSSESQLVTSAQTAELYVRLAWPEIRFPVTSFDPV